MIVRKGMISKSLFGLEAVYREKKRIADDYFEGRCYVCEREVWKGICISPFGLWILKERTTRISRTPSNINRYVLPEVEAYPERFYLLCRDMSCKD